MLEILNWEHTGWEEFVARSQNSTIFHTKAWAQTLNDTYHNPIKVLAWQTSPQIVTAGIPFMEVTDILGRRSWISLPFSDHCSPLYKDEYALQLFISAIENRVKSSQGLSCEIRWDIPMNETFLKQNDHVLHQLHLAAEFKMNCNEIHNMHLRNVEKAKKNGLESRIRVDELGLKEFYALHTTTRRKIGVPVQPWEFFRQVYRHLIMPGFGHLQNVYLDNKCIASAIFLFHNQSLTYKYGASDPAYLHLRPNNLLFWEAIKWGCEQNYTYLDLGRTDVENKSLREFKTRWGAEEQSLSYSYLPQLPHGIPKWIQKTSARAISASPEWVCRLIGEFAYRAVV